MVCKCLLVMLQESFLEDVNSILNSGEVPDLFDNEEIDGIAMDLEAAAVLAQVPATRHAIYQFFVQVHVTPSFCPSQADQCPCCIHCVTFS